MAPVKRQRPALNDPPKDLHRLDGFPEYRLRKGKQLFRAHAALNGPWWFASDDQGRFNLEPPYGTCYLGIDVETAVRERLGNDLMDYSKVSAKFAAEMVVSKLAVQVGGKLANVGDRRAVRHGVNRLVSTYSSARYGYAKTRKWAAAFKEIGMRGIRYESRFTTVAKANAFAVFDDAGDAGLSKSWPADPTPMAGVEACQAAGLTVLPVPRARHLRIVPPPS
ncbi:RES family NAD+ phosphorylase [Mycobacterium colombiense]|uniref:RES family NAD+ phosphorylase n=1 Tax=Mycobacterium colombiense TaxID=339268 RepID=UPI000949E2B1